MNNQKHSMGKRSVLIVYVLVFYGIWTVWEFWGSPWISGVIQKAAIYQGIEGVVKNILWTLPAALLIRHFEADVYIGLKEMFTTKVSLIKYLPIFGGFTAYLLAGTVLQTGKIAISETFVWSDLIVVLFVGITEEMVFRGWLLNAGISEKKKWMGVILNALLFLAIHFPVWLRTGCFVESFQNLGFLCILLLSLIFSWTFIKSRNLLIPIALHMYWDLLMFLLY